MQVYLVGGAVRDELLGRAVKERDWVVVGATPAELEGLGYRAVGREFPVFLHPETKEEYALARLERKVAPGYRGFVTEFSPTVTLEEDLQRRDLTINAMARDAKGQIIDPFGGRADLEARVLRHVSPAFAEDPVRILRVARFAARYEELGFKVAPETMTLMRHMVQNGEAGALVSERVWRELEGTLETASPQRGLEVLSDCGALGVLLPELARSADASQDMRALRAAAESATSSAVRWATLLGGLAATDIEALCERLRTPTEHRELALLTARLEREFASALDPASSPEQLLSLLEQADAFRRPERFARWLEVLAARRRGAEVAAQATTALLAGLRTAAAAAAAVQLSADELRAHRGPQLGAAMRARRLKAIGSQLS
jgi:tRNA nucleotidyltransferase (CCA-adding enzyme)